MNRKKLCTAGVITIIFAVLVLAHWETVNAQDCRIIRIHGMAVHESIRVEPETLLVSKGDCVIWFNRAAANEIKIVFEEGKRCASVSDAPMGFSLDHNECFVTSWIPFAGTSSLRFKEAGAYDYAIEATGGGSGEKGRKVAEGKIVVRE